MLIVPDLLESTFWKTCRGKRNSYALRFITVYKKVFLFFCFVLFCFIFFPFTFLDIVQHPLISQMNVLLVPELSIVHPTIINLVYDPPPHLTSPQPHPQVMTLPLLHIPSDSYWFHKWMLSWTQHSPSHHHHSRLGPPDCDFTFLTYPLWYSLISQVKCSTF